MNDTGIMQHLNFCCLGKGNITRIKPKYTKIVQECYLDFPLFMEYKAKYEKSNRHKCHTFTIKNK